MLVISDSSVLIALIKAGKLDLLPKLFKQIQIPEAVYNELTQAGIKKTGTNCIQKANWISISKVTNKIQVNYLLNILDRGEAEVLTLAQELDADLILLDEKKARNSANIAGLEVMGTLGLFILAKDFGLIDKIAPLINKLQAKGFRLSHNVISEALDKAKER